MERAFTTTTPIVSAMAAPVLQKDFGSPASGPTEMWATAVWGTKGAWDTSTPEGLQAIWGSDTACGRPTSANFWDFIAQSGRASGRITLCWVN
jgi:hypothetical protein